jgi:hypothetical protein
MLIFTLVPAYAFWASNPPTIAAMANAIAMLKPYTITFGCLDEKLLIVDIIRWGFILLY